MFNYFATINNTLEFLIWVVLLLIIISFAIAFIYKIIKAEHIKAGPVEIVDEEAKK